MLRRALGTVLRLAGGLLTEAADRLLGERAPELGPEPGFRPVDYAGPAKIAISEEGERMRDRPPRRREEVAPVVPLAGSARARMHGNRARG